MSDIIRPGAGILFMKVGTHAKESLTDIIERKREEIRRAGHALWGYGGNTCHPATMVQPFAKAFQRRGQSIVLCMEPMASKHFADPVRAEQSSVDGVRWEDIPAAINVRGSRFALAIKELHQEEFELPLERTRVAIGPNMGRGGQKYISGQVDKACLEITDTALEPETRIVRIGLVAELIEPYALFLRNKPATPVK
jgi:hypothetical protein